MDRFGKLGLDTHILDKLHGIKEVVEVSPHEQSDWSDKFRIDTILLNDATQSYFLKISKGNEGRLAMEGEFESISAIYSVAPDFAPRPVGWGTFNSDPNTHFFLCHFCEMSPELPEPEIFCSKLVKLHQSGSSPNGKFGFHVTTFNGNLLQDNTFTDTWEKFFANGLKHMLKVRDARAGPCPELEAISSAMFEKVIPRLLRPLESNGNSIKPELVHGDLWCGNVAVDIENDQPMIYDACCFWAHNEYELGNWRPERNRFSKSYFNAYHKLYPPSSPKKDYDDRNRLYSIRFNLHASALFPDKTEFKQFVIEDMKFLISKFPNGYDGFVAESEN